MADKQAEAMAPPAYNDAMKQPATNPGMVNPPYPTQAPYPQQGFAAPYPPQPGQPPYPPGVRNQALYMANYYFPSFIFSYIRFIHFILFITTFDVMLCTEI